MNLSDLTRPGQPYSYAFLDAYAKRELRRALLKAVALPGYQVPYASREVPMARGWGTGGLQVTLALIGAEDCLKVIDQGDDNSVNAVSLRRFIGLMSGAQTTTDTLKATLIQSRHRIPEERLNAHQTLVLQVPIPEPLAYVEPSYALAAERHADAEYAQIWLGIYEDLVRWKVSTQGADYPVLVHGRYLMAPSPIPRWDVPKLHQAAHLTLLAAGREKRLYAVPPFTDVRPVEFSDERFQVEDQRGWQDAATGVNQHFMTEIPLANGGVRYEVSDTGLLEKIRRQQDGEPVEIGATYYDQAGQFYRPGLLAEEQE